MEVSGQLHAPEPTVGLSVGLNAVKKRKSPTPRVQFGPKGQKPYAYFSL
jgi:hypothetical protein